MAQPYRLLYFQGSMLPILITEVSLIRFNVYNCLPILAHSVA